MPATATLQELRDERATVVKEAQKIDAAAKAESRFLTNEEEQKVNELLETSAKLKAEIQEGERKNRIADRLLAEMADLDAPQGRRSKSGDPNAETSNKNKNVIINLRGKDIILAETSEAAKRHTPDMRGSWEQWVIGGAQGRGGLYADLQTDIDGTGGYLTVPEEFMSGIIKTADDDVSIRKLAKKILVNAQSTGIRCRTAKLSTAAWGQELDNTYDHRDRSLRFGKRVLTPHWMTGEVIISRDLLRAAVMDVESIVADEVARDFSELEEKGFLYGDGSQKPLGLLTPSTDGISTGRDVSTGSTQTSFTFDSLIEAKFSLKPKYRSRASWIFHRQAVKKIALMKDGEGQYIWQPSRVAGEPDRILNLPYLESEWMPSTFLASQYYGIIGDFTYYFIADNLFMDMQRLVEKYSETNQIAFVYRRKTDGAPVLEEAFSRLQLAA